LFIRVSATLCVRAAKYRLVPKLSAVLLLFGFSLLAGLLVRLGLLESVLADHLR
jgi:hypothetical protein